LTPNLPIKQSATIAQHNPQNILTRFATIAIALSRARTHAFGFFARNHPIFLQIKAFSVCADKFNRTGTQGEHKSESSRVWQRCKPERLGIVPAGRGKEQAATL
jgi:hypothetical protein